MFSKLGLSPTACASLARLGYETPTPIQLKAIPLVLTGVDLLARAQTGTGKTAAFGLPMIDRLSRPDSGTGRRTPRGLVLVPTRELAVQVHQALCRLRRAHAPSHRRHLRRRRHGRTDPGAPARRGHRRRHARPPHRSPAAADGRPLRGRGAHAGRRRSDAGHGLPARAPDRRCGAAAPPTDVAVLRHAVRGHYRSRGGVHARRPCASMSHPNRWSRRP